MLIFKDRHTELTTFAVVYIMPVLMHLIGLYLLFTTKVTNLAINQKYYIISMSGTELCICTLKIAHRIFSIYGFDSVAFKLWTLQTSGCFLCYILSMILLTVDRFLEVYLNIKYPLWLTERVSKILISSSWVVSALFAVGFIIQEDMDKVRYSIIVYFWPISELTFLFIAILVYVFCS